MPEANAQTPGRQLGSTACLTRPSMSCHDSDDEGELLTEAEESDDEMNFLFDQEGAAQPKQAKESSWTVIDQHKLEEVQVSWGCWPCNCVHHGGVSYHWPLRSAQQSRPFPGFPGCQHFPSLHWSVHVEPKHSVTCSTLSGSLHPALGRSLPLHAHQDVLLACLQVQEDSWCREPASAAQRPSAQTCNVSPPVDICPWLFTPAPLTAP